MQNAIATFVINEQGKVTDVSIIKSTGIISVDSSIIDLLYKMPKWSPAKNSSNKVIKQQFEFVIGAGGC